jgi:hypothetical protein
MTDWRRLSLRFPGYWRRCARPARHAMRRTKRGLRPLAGPCHFHARLQQATAVDRVRVVQVEVAARLEYARLWATTTMRMRMKRDTRLHRTRTHTHARTHTHGLRVNNKYHNCSDGVTNQSRHTALHKQKKGLSHPPLAAQQGNSQLTTDSSNSSQQTAQTAHNRHLKQLTTDTSNSSQQAAQTASS